MAFDRDSMAAYEQQPQTMVEIPVVAVEVAADLPPQGEPEVDVPATPADESSGADDAAAGESSGEEVEGEAPTPSGETSAATEAPAKGSARARIMELVDERNSYKDFGLVAQEDNKRLRAELAALKGDKPVTPAAEETPAVAETDADTPPSPEDPDVQYDPVKLQLKNVKWMKEQIAKGVKAETAQAQTTTAAETAQREVTKRFTDQVKVFEVTTPDFKAVIGNPDLPQLCKEARAVIIGDVDGQSAALLYAVGKDVKVAKEIAALPPAMQVLRIGMIKARLETPTAPVVPATPVVPAVKPVKQPKTVTSAPPPPTKVPAGAAPNTEQHLSDPGLSMEDFVKKDRAQKAATREAKRTARLGMR